MARTLPDQETSGKQNSMPSGTVTFLFTDIEGSTPLWEKMPEVMQASVAQHHAILRRAVEASGGRVSQIIGDSFQAAFRTPGQAVTAALVAQRGLRDAAWGETGPIRVRMGIHTGPAELDPKGDAPYAVSHTLNRAARVMSAGHGGQILLSGETTELVRRGLPDGAWLKDLGEHHLKGMSIPEHLYQVAAPDLSADFPPLVSATRHPNNLPPELTTFIGREVEIAWLLERFASLAAYPAGQVTRLLTLTGAGGTGKTRLALRLAEVVLDHFPDGAWLAELAPLSDPALVSVTVAQVLGVHEVGSRSLREALANYLEKKRLLVILDNCEHLLEECSRLADFLLHRCPKLVILATSREILNVTGESSFRVPSLAVPEAEQSLEQAGNYAAVRLFVERARLAVPDFCLDAANLSAVVTICRRLDGVPLAIELAAARMRMLTAQQIAARLDNVFRLLTGGSRSVLPRQQTLKATIDWSYALLSGPEKSMLQRLSVFAGSWSLEAAESVCAGAEIEPETVLDLLGELVDKSLVQPYQTEAGEDRYRMLETVRQYARDRLLEAGGSEAVRDRHLDYYLRLGEQAQAGLPTARQLEWVNRLEHDLENFRLALEWAEAERIVDGLRLGTAIMWFYHYRSRDAQCAQILKKLLDAETTRWGNKPAPEEAPETLVRSAAMNACLFLCYFTSTAFPRDQVPALLEENIAICRRIGGPASRELAWALILHGWFSTGPNRTRAIHQYQESLAISRSNHDPFYEAEALLHWGGALRNIPQGTAVLESALAVAEPIGETDRTATARMWLAGNLWFIEKHPGSSGFYLPPRPGCPPPGDGRRGLFASLGSGQPNVAVASVPVWNPGSGL